MGAAGRVNLFQPVVPLSVTVLSAVLPFSPVAAVPPLRAKVAVQVLGSRTERENRCVAASVTPASVS